MRIFVKDCESVILQQISGEVSSTEKRIMNNSKFDKNAPESRNSTPVTKTEPRKYLAVMEAKASRSGRIECSTASEATSRLA